MALHVYEWSDGIPFHLQQQAELLVDTHEEDESNVVENPEEEAADE